MKRIVKTTAVTCTGESARIGMARARVLRPAGRSENPASMAAAVPENPVASCPVNHVLRKVKATRNQRVIQVRTRAVAWRSPKLASTMIPRHGTPRARSTPITASSPARR
jgi:hypothetical protein